MAIDGAIDGSRTVKFTSIDSKHPRKLARNMAMKVACFRRL